LEIACLVEQQDRLNYLIIKIELLNSSKSRIRELTSILIALKIKTTKNKPGLNKKYKKANFLTLFFLNIFVIVLCQAKKINNQNRELSA
jgi:hypothetical protein